MLYSTRRSKRLNYEGCPSLATKRRMHIFVRSHGLPARQRSTQWPSRVTPACCHHILILFCCTETLTGAGGAWGWRINCCRCWCGWLPQWLPLAAMLRWTIVTVSSLWMCFMDVAFSQQLIVEHFYSSKEFFLLVIVAVRCNALEVYTRSHVDDFLATTARLFFCQSHAKLPEETAHHICLIIPVVVIAQVIPEICPYNLCVNVILHEVNQTQEGILIDEIFPPRVCREVS